MYPMGSNFYKANLGEVGFRLVAVICSGKYNGCYGFNAVYGKQFD